MLALALLMMGATIAAPTYLLVSLVRNPGCSWRRWLVKVSYTGVFLAYVFLAARWDLVSLYLRYAVPVLYVAAVLASLRPAQAAGRDRGGGRPSTSEWITVAIGLALLAWTVRGFAYGGAPVRLAAPLGPGWFYLGQGGSGSALNYHGSAASQRYAVDIVALGAFGTRANGLHPRDLTRYAIYGVGVHSPCRGVVAAIVDGLPDQSPPSRDRARPAGNHIVITCGDVNVVLAHLLPGSVAVRVGQEVTVGERVARVGNSGNSTEPHLHVHAVRAGSADPLEGDAIPMLIDATFPVRNTTFVVAP